MLKQVSIDALLTGMYVSKVIEQVGPMKVKRVGFIKSAEMVDGLNEMGVKLVEVDLEKSLKVEFEPNVPPQHTADETIEKKPETPPEQRITLTERLLDSDKQVEQVDRELSQQFHNSLVMSAVDDMPSRIELYGKPLAMMLLLCCMGFVAGFVAMQTPYLWQQLQSSEKRVISETTPEPQTNQGSALVTSVAPSQTGAAPAAANTVEQNVTAQNNLNQSNSAISNSPLVADVNAVNSQAQEYNQPAQVISEQDSADIMLADTVVETQSIATEGVNGDGTSENDDLDKYFTYEDIRSNETPVKTLDPVQGIELEEGARVLGYQGESMEQSAPEVRSDEDKINPQLLERINNAIASLEDDPVAINSDPVKVRDTYLRVDQLSPLIQDQLPSLSFSVHMYASDAQDRWVRVNGRRLEEGDKITSDLGIEEISADTVLLNFRGQRFTMKALSDWQ